MGENTEKYITFSAAIKKKLHNAKTVTYKLKFIDSFRFMWTSLSYLVDNLSEIYKKECKGFKSGCDFIGTKNNKLNCKRKSCKKRWLKPVNELIKNLPNIHKFCNSEINTFVLLLRKGVYPYKYMDS